MSVLLINPIGIQRDVPAVGLTYMATFLKDKGYKVKICDANFLNIDVFPVIDRWNPDVVGVSAFTYNISEALRIARYCKNKGKKVVLGGPHISVTSEELLHKCDFIDFLVVGEGELSFHQLVDGLEQGNNFETTPGLIFRRGQEIVRNNPRFIDDLDSLPFPDYGLANLYNLKEYFIWS